MTKPETHPSTHCTTEVGARPPHVGKPCAFPPAHVCILSASRDPFDERFFHKIGASLKRRYSTVTVVAPWSQERAEVDGISVRGIDDRKGVRVRLRRLSQLWRIGKELQADVYQCEELDAWLIGILLRRRFGSQVVYDAHECNIVDLPTRFPRVLRPLAAQLIRSLEGFLARRTGLVLVANQITRAYYLLHNRFLPVAILYNVPRLSLFQEHGPEAERPFDFCHEGHLRFNRGLKTMIGALIKVRVAYPKVRLLIVGELFGAENVWFQGAIERHGLRDNITVTGWLKYADVGKYVGQCRVGLITMEPSPNNMLAGPPNKLFNYMRYGLPVIAPQFPEISRIIREENCGVIYRPSSEDDLCANMSSLMADPKRVSMLGANGASAALRRYNWEAVEPELLDAYAVLSERASHGSADVSRPR